jgi:pentapeptide MXKDX repeat protein
MEGSMDRNDSNPGMIERQLDESPMEGRSSSDTELDRETPQRGHSTEREGMQGDGMERDSMHGEGMEREGMRGDGAERESMHGDGMERESMEGEPREEREGGYGMDRPADNSTTTARDW